MRAAVVFGISFGIVSVVACGSANIDSVFSKDCTKDEDCASGSYCKVGVCLASSAGGASGSGGDSGSGGGEASGGETHSSGGTSSGGAASGGTVGGGGVSEAGGASDSGGAQGSGGSSNTGGDASGGSDPGSGGSSGDGGSSASGGNSGSGGAKATGGTPSTGGSSGDDGVYCGSRYCSEGQACCLGIATRPMAPPQVTYTCSKGACAVGEGAIQCSAKEDCPESQKCCQIPLTSITGVLFKCQDDCPAAEIECTGPNVCNAGEVCCESTNGTGAAETPAATECKAQCQGTNGSGEYILCHSNEDCPGRLPRCDDSNLLYGFKRCWPN